MSFQSNVFDEVWYINSHNSFHTDAVDELRGEDVEYITEGHLRYIKTKKQAKSWHFLLSPLGVGAKLNLDTWKRSYDS